MKQETRADQAKLLVVQAEALIARQQRLVAELDPRGCRIEEAQRLLGLLEYGLITLRSTVTRLQGKY